MTLSAKSPSFSEYFRSFYCENPETYSPLLSIDDYRSNEECATCSISHRKVWGVMYDPARFGLLTLPNIEKRSKALNIEIRTVVGQECLLSKREETIDKIKKLSDQQQIDLAKKLCDAVRIRDIIGVSLNRFRIYTDSSTNGVKIEFLVSMNDVPITTIKGLFTGTACEYIKLSRLVKEATQTFGTGSDKEGAAFLGQLKKELHKSKRPRFSYGTLAFSILSCGIIPLFYAIFSLIQVYQIQEKCHQLNQLKMESSSPVKNLQRLGLSILRMTDGVTFNGREGIIHQMSELQN